MRSSLRLAVRKLTPYVRFQPNAVTLFRCNPCHAALAHCPAMSRWFFASSSNQYRCFHLTRPCTEQQQDNDKKKWNFHLTMTDEQKIKKKEKIDAAALEEAPPGLFGKVKYYLKRYWYIAIPAHAVSCTSWFIGLYALVHSGVDVPHLLEMFHMPELIVEKVKSTPQSAGIFVVAVILYKIAIPLRYITTLGLIQATFWGLKRVGKLRTAREVEYKVRTDYESMKKTWGRRQDYYEFEGVRAYTRRKSEEMKRKIELELKKKAEALKKSSK